MKKLKQKLKNLDSESIDRVVEMAWEDRTPFEAIGQQFGLTEQEVIQLMRQEMKASSWRMWRKRVQGRKTKHQKLRSNQVNRFHCSRQKSISQNAAGARRPRVCRCRKFNLKNLLTMVYQLMAIQLNLLGWTRARTTRAIVEV